MLVYFNTGSHDTIDMHGSFFTTEDKQWFMPTPHCRGPWDPEACHAGPPTGLLARALEQLLPEQRLTRITVNLIRPIPYQGFRIEASTTREGRTVSTTTASLLDADGKTRATAMGLHITEQVVPIQLPTISQAMGLPEDAIPGDFPIKQLHKLDCFNGEGVQTRYPAGESGTTGPSSVWLKTVPLLENEIPTAFQKICPLADCGNAFSRNAEPTEVSFVNPDLTIVLHRDPVGEWFGSQSIGYWEPSCIGLADALLYDRNGVVGRAMQTLVLRPSN